MPKGRHYARSSGLKALLLLLLLAGCGRSRAAAPQTFEPQADDTGASGIAPAEAADNQSGTDSPPITWETLKNTAYPNEWPDGGVAKLVDGEYREKYTPDSATELVINIAPFRIFGDLDSDGDDDVAVILITMPGDPGTFYNLVPVINQNGTAVPLAAVFLGDRVFIHKIGIKDGNVIVVMDISGPEDPLCCPTDRRRFVYMIDGARLVVIENVDLPDPKAAARLDMPRETTNLVPEKPPLQLPGPKASTTFILILFVPSRGRHWR